MQRRREMCSAGEKYAARERNMQCRGEMCYIEEKCAAWQRNEF